MKRNEWKKGKRETAVCGNINFLLHVKTSFHRSQERNSNEAEMNWNAKKKAMWETVGDRVRVELRVVVDVCLETAEQYCAMHSWIAWREDLKKQQNRRNFSPSSSPTATVVYDVFLPLKPFQNNEKAASAEAKDSLQDSWGKYLFSVLF